MFREKRRHRRSVATDDSRQHPRQHPTSPKASAPTSLFGAPEPGSADRGTAGMPLIKKTAHVKSRALIPASDTGPVLPLFDAHEMKSSRAPGKTGRPTGEKARVGTRAGHVSGRSGSANRSE